MLYLNRMDVRGRHKRLRRISFTKKMWEEKISTVFHAEEWDIICSYHLFEFQGILCKYAISVLMHNDIISTTDRRILRRWMRDVCTTHTRTAMNYDNLVSTLGQLRYDRTCEAFATLIDIIADDEEWTRAIIDWIQLKSKDIMSTKLICGSNSISQPGLNLWSQSRASHDTCSGNIWDPKCSKMKDGPKKLRNKSPLKSCSKKSKVLCCFFMPLCIQMNRKYKIL